VSNADLALSRLSEPEPLQEIMPSGNTHPTRGIKRQGKGLKKSPGKMPGICVEEIEHVEGERRA